MKWVVVASVVTAAASCGSHSSSVAELAQGCSINSDCDAPLVCVFAKCHAACAETRDCPTGERCVPGGKYDVCTLPDEESCTGGDAASICPGALVCGSDGECRAACATSSDCIPGQSCTNAVCVEMPDLTVVGSEGGSSPGDAAGGPTDGSPDVPFVPVYEAGVLGYFPTNVSPVDTQTDVWPDAGDAAILGTHISQTSCTNSCIAATPTTVAQTDPDGTLADLYMLDSLTVDATATLSLTGPRPIILAVRGPVDIQGLVDAAGVGYTPGPGGFAPGTDPGPGSGGIGNEAAYPHSLAGGASYCGAGGQGGATAPPNAPGGPTYGEPTLHPLIGGSAGGDFSAYGDNSAGAGGGAIEIVSGTSISIGPTGAIHAGGGGFLGGGGSGGAILLEAPAVVVHGTVGANGGGGGGFGVDGANATANAQPAPGYGGVGGAGSAGTNVNGGAGQSIDGGITASGGGGAGRIRINTASGSADVTGGTLSPALGTPCATQGTITP